MCQLVYNISTLWLVDDFDDQVDTLNNSLREFLDLSVPIEGIKIKSTLNPFVSAIIRQVTNTPDSWHKRGIKLSKR